MKTKNQLASEYPYIVFRLLPAMYKVVPVYINIAKEDIYETKGVYISVPDGPGYESEIILKLKHAVKLFYDIIEARFRMCIVLSNHFAIYYDNGIFTESEKIPRGGVKVYGDEYNILNNSDQNLL